MTNGTARSALRLATASDHDAVDRAFSGYDLTDRSRYTRFLTAQASAFLPVEAAIDRSPAIGAIQDWRSRRRAELLRQDLSLLGVEPVEPPALAAFETVEAVLGAVYVLEGSRLGGRMLARRVPADFPCSFLAAGNPAQWRSLLTLLEERLATAQQRAMAIAAARSVFALFEKGA